MGSHGVYGAIRARAAALRPSLAYARLFSTADRTDVVLLVVGTIAAIGAGVPLPLIGLFFGKMVDGFNEASCTQRSGQTLTADERDKFLDGVSEHVVNIVIIAAVNFALIWIYTCAWSMLGERTVRRLRQGYVRALLRQDMSFFDAMAPGEIATRLSENLVTVQNGTSEKVGILIAAISYFVTSYIVAFVLLPVLAAQLISLIPAFLLASLVGAYFVSRFTEAVQAQLAHAMGIANEMLANLSIVQAFGAQKPLGELYSRHLVRAHHAGIRRAVSAGVMLGCLFFVGYAANALAFYSGSRIVIDGLADGVTTRVGAVYTVVFLLIDASFVVGQISPYLQTFSAAAGAGRTLLETIRATPSINSADTTGLRPERTGPLGFRLNNVRFSYPARPDALTLDGVDLDLERGKRIGICGMSGSGKSTIVSLLQRFYDPSEGSVVLHDGTDVRDVNVHWLRSQIGLVGQEPVLFDCTVLESIAHGLYGSALHAHLADALLFFSRHVLDHPDDPMGNIPEQYREPLREIEELCVDAAKLAHAHHFIAALPHGYYSRVGDSGRSLSGGQKQRIALARAIVRKPCVLILDEATAALDSHSEQIVQAAFDSVSQNRTTIAIAHRLATIKNYDKIVVMAHGRVVEQGTHATLLASGGYYSDLVAAQTDSCDRDDAVSDASQKTTVSPSSAPAADDAPELGDPLMPGQVVTAAAPAPMPADPIIEPHTEKTAPVFEHATTAPVTYTAAMLRLMRWALARWPLVLVGLLASAVIGGTYSGEAVLFGHVIEALNPCKSADEIRSQSDLFALMFFVMALIELCAYTVSGTAFGLVSESLLQRIRRVVFDVLSTQNATWYAAQGQSPPSMIATLAADISNLGGLTSTVIGTIFSILVNMIAGVILAHIVAWRIAIVILATVPIIMAAGYMRLKVIADFQKRHETVYARSTAIAVEATTHIRTVAALGREDDVLQLYQHSLVKPYKESVRHIIAGNCCLAISLSISYFVYGFAYWWGSQNVADARYSQVAFFTVLPALLFSAQSSGQLLAFAPDFTKAQVSAANIFSLLERAQNKHAFLPAAHAGVHEHAAADLEKDAAGSSAGAARTPLPVTFEHVMFTYPDRDDPALRGVDLDIKPGSFAAFVGESGSGKSTAMSLIEAFYKPSSGTVRIGGRTTHTTPESELRAEMAIVPQEAMLFHGSVAFNVALGLRDPGDALAEGVTDPRVVKACEDAHVHDAIMRMPDNYQTNVGSGGKQLSGGQRQRVAIARALAREPRLLLLDESTSAMDAASESAFQKTIEELRASRTCTIIAIAHRLRTIVEADQIFVFSHGKIVAQGNHAELYAKSEQYRAMVAHQSLGDPL
ncbi:hypothetical protein MCUN1_003449 [Malassezia cuniculi]|uniref:Leptomycin B resistance protein pmd1 n=1 Tax=Malassezia cuniculi TaxID=948313 RepID=A0AAF0EYG6_9BASI|nr:hypothetical protein MCUN1_003449 [Malassezia cuniculi]